MHQTIIHLGFPILWAIFALITYAVLRPVQMEPWKRGLLMLFSWALVPAVGLLVAINMGFEPFIEEEDYDA